MTYYFIPFTALPCAMAAGVYTPQQLKERGISWGEFSKLYNFAEQVIDNNVIRKAKQFRGCEIEDAQIDALIDEYDKGIVAYEEGNIVWAAPISESPNQYNVTFKSVPVSSSWAVEAKRLADDEQKNTQDFFNSIKSV
jgi:hypothetical protein